MNLRKRKPVDYTATTPVSTEEPEAEKTPKRSKRSRKSKDEGESSSPKESKGKRLRVSLKRIDTAAVDDAPDTPPLKQKKKKSWRSPLKRQASSIIVPRPALTQYESDPLLDDSAPAFLDNSTIYWRNKIFLRYAANNDLAALEEMLKDPKSISNVCLGRSPHVGANACELALIAKNFDAVKLIKSDEYSKIERIQAPMSLLHAKSSGHYDFHMLGHSIKAIGATRGGKEGNNALTVEPGHGFRMHCSQIVEHLDDVSEVEKLQAIGQLEFDQVRCLDVTSLIRAGKRECAGKLIKDYMQGMDFNELHSAVLLAEKEELPQYRQISILKKGRSARNANPVHFACINPNAKYLKQLASEEPMFNEQDRDNWRPVHYAAVCSGVAPLKYLIEEAKVPGTRSEVTTKKETILHVAAMVNRPESVKYILTKIPDLYDARSREGYTALHYAAMNGHGEAVKEFIDHCETNDQDIDVLSGPARGKVTPLHLACQQGHYGVMKMLIDGGAKPTAKDKLKKAPLIYAVCDGQAHITSYLLKLGVNSNTMDNSGNTAVHYASAYGWVYDLKLLIEAGAKLDRENDWKLTPLAVAYLKGHMNICDLLLEHLPAEAINCQDENGMSLLSLTLSIGEPSNEKYDQAKYLLVTRKAEANKQDSLGNNALHHLSVLSSDDMENSKVGANFVKLAQLLIDHGVDYERKNDEGKTPLVTALLAGNAWLAIFLMNRSAALDYTEEKDLEGKGFLVDVIEKLDEMVPDQLTDVLQLLCEKYPDQVKGYLANKVFNGLTPFLCILGGFLEGPSPFKDSDDQNQRPWHSRRIRKTFRMKTARRFQTRARFRHFGGRGFGGAGQQDETEKTSKSERYYEVIKMLLNVEPEVLVTDIVSKQKGKVAKEDDDDDDSDNEDENRPNKKEDPEAPMVSFDRLWNGQNCLHVVAGQVKEEKGSKDSFHRKLLELLQTKLAAFAPERRKEVMSKYDENNLTPEITGYLAKNRPFVLSSIDFFKDSPNGDWHLPMRLRRKRGLDDLSLISLAVEAGIPEAVQSYTNLFSSEEIGKRDGLGNSALHYAAMYPHFEGMRKIAQTILQKCPELINSKNNFGRTPLHFAANADSATVESNTELLDFLLANGANPVATDESWRTPLHCAFVKFKPHDGSPAEATETTDYSEFDPVAAVLSFEKYNPQSFVTKRDKDGYTALHYAAVRGSMISIGRLVRLERLDAYSQNDVPPPMALACKFKHLSAALALLQEGATLRESVTFRVTQACLKKWADANMWEWIGTRGAMPKDQLTTILELIISNEWQGMLHIFLHTMNPDEKISSDGRKCVDEVLLSALKFQKYSLATMLIDRFKGHFSSSGVPFLSTLFDRCESNSCEQLIKLAAEMVDAGLTTWIPPNSDKEMHPIHYAAQFHRFDILKQLRKVGEIRKASDFAETDQSDPLNILRVFSGQANTYNFFSNLFCNCNFSKKQWRTNVLPVVRKAAKEKGPAAVFNVVALLPSRSEVSQDQIDMDPDNKDAVRSKNTLLSHLISFAPYFVVRDVLRLGADVNYAPDGTRPPLVHAILRNDPHIVALLLDPHYKVRTADATAQEETRRFGVTEHDDSQSEVSYNDDESYIGAHDGDAEDVADEEGDEEMPEENEGDEEENQEDEPENEENDAQSEGSDKAPDDEFDFSQEREDSEKVVVIPTKIDVTSDIRIDWTDKAATPRGYVQYAVSALDPDCTFADGHVLKLLMNSGFTSQPGTTPVEDIIVKRGFTPLDSFVSARSKSAESERGFSLSTKELELNLSQFDSSKLEEYADKFMVNAKAKAPPVKVEPRRPNKLTDMHKTGELVADETGKLYDVAMTKVDISSNVWGNFNFYEIQLIKRKGAELYVVFTHWGRIGCYPGQYQQTPFGNKEAAVKEFCKIFKSKSKNKWEDYAKGDFVEHEKKYQPRKQDTSEDAVAKHLYLKFDLDLSSPVKATLGQLVLDVIKDLADPQIVQSGVDRTLENISHGNIAGHGGFAALSAESLEEARQVLAKQVVCIERLESIRDQIRKSNKGHEKIRDVYQELVELSNKLYYLLPFTGYAGIQLPVIQTLNDVNSLESALRAVTEVHTAGKILMAAAFNKAHTNPFDAIYDMLDRPIGWAKAADPTTQLILHYIRNTTEKKVKGIFSVGGPALTHRENRKILFHGTKPEHLLSILKCGLLPAPLHAQQMGHLFGKGVYLSDQFTKSEDYCTKSQGGSQYMLLCEVALGSQMPLSHLGDINMEDLKKYDSVLGVGENTPDPRRDVVLPGGCVIPLGASVTRKAPELRIALDVEERYHVYFNLNQNEYVVYDPTRIAIRYLIVF